MSLHHITTREKVIVMLAVMSALLLVALDQTIISTAISAIANSTIALVVSVLCLRPTCLPQLHYDATRRKLSEDVAGLCSVGVAVFTVGSFLSGHADSMSQQLIMFRALQGIGGGIITANAFTIVGDLFSPRERGKWQGLIGAGVLQ